MDQGQQETAVAAGDDTPRGEAAPDRAVQVAVIGAGAGGLCMAIGLRNRGITDFLVLEKSDGVGGTWRDNTYPGSGCDVPSHFYSFSFAPNPDWSRKWAAQPEILDYFEGLVDRFGLGPHLRFGTEVTELSWSDDDRRWTLRTDAGDTIHARVVVCGLGQLNSPYVPDIPGLGSFRGPVFHSARWDHTHDLTGERVGVIGIGASAIQFVPPVARVAGHTTLFQRSANYVAPKPDREFRPWERWVFRHVPGVRTLYRAWTWARLEARFSIMARDSRLGTLLVRRFEAGVAPMISEDLPREALVPDYRPGCKRILLSDDWYPTLLRDDVDVVTSDVVEVTPDGVTTADGRHVELDALVFGTGFRSTRFLTPMKVTGAGGRDLNEVWDGGAVAYMGLSVAGFPNFFLLYGPNTNLGHNSILFMIEQQVGYVMAALEQLERRGAAAIDVTEAALGEWDREMRRRSAETVWAGDCTSWYKTDDGRVTNNWVGHTYEYRRRARHPQWDDWRFLRPAGG